MECAPHFLGDNLDGLVYVVIEEPDKMVRKERNVFLPFPEARHFEADNVEPVVEVLPEIAVFHLVPEVFVGGGDHLEIDLDIFFPPEPPELSFLDDLDELGLEIKAHVPYFVEEDRSAVRVLENPGLRFLRVRERAGLVSEELAFQEVLGYRGAVHFEKRLFGPPAAVVQHLRGEALSRPGLARDKHHARILGSEFSEKPGQVFNYRAHADERPDAVLLFFVLRRHGHRLFEVRGVKRVLEYDLYLVHGEGLFDEVVRAETHGRYGRFDVAVRGDHYSYRRLIELV